MNVLGYEYFVHKLFTDKDRQSQGDGRQKEKEGFLQ